MTDLSLPKELSENLTITDLTIYYPNDQEKLQSAKPLKAIAKVIINNCLIIREIKIFSYDNVRTFIVYPEGITCLLDLRIELEYAINSELGKK